MRIDSITRLSPQRRRAEKISSPGEVLIFSPKKKAWAVGIKNFPPPNLSKLQQEILYKSTLEHFPLSDFEDREVFYDTLNGKEEDWGN